ncbi:MAG TPA: PHB depolymerase family esterase [Kofleriaceae bacterium]|nr:PHB depolymerase family esterase [Kofleriaceae bacterium]
MLHIHGLRAAIPALVMFLGCASNGADDVAAAGAAITDPVPAAAGRYDLRFDVSNGDQRAYILRLPVGYNPAAAPYPVVFLFHGAGQSADSFYGRPGMVQMEALADAQGKILVFGQGRLGTSVALAGAWDTTGAIRDDLLYVQELLDYLLANMNADATRVLAAGFSNGGHFTHFLGASMPCAFRAIGVVEGYYGSAAQPAPAPPPAGTLLPTFIVHGDADPVVPIAGGGAGGFTSALDAYNSWYSNDSCSQLTAILAFPLPNYTFRFTGCRRGTSGNVVRFTTVFGLGHEWPTAGNGFDASDELLAFFDQQ